MRFLSLLIGYILGNILTAEIVTRKLTGKPCSELGTTGNPGMANVMAHLGFKPGITVLIGDLAKCALSCFLAWLLFHWKIGSIAVLWAGLGCTLGHDFPIGIEWSTTGIEVPSRYISIRGASSEQGAGKGLYLHLYRRRGGKGVAVSCLAIFLYSPLWGFIANVVGMLVTFTTKYLCIGGAVLPAVFVLPMFLFRGPEAGVLSLILAAVCFWKHWPAIRTIPSGTCERTDVWGAIVKAVKEKLGNRRDANEK